MNKEDLQKVSIIVSLVLSLVLIVNTSLSTYLLYTGSFQASIPATGETLDVSIKADTGRPSPLGQIWHEIRDWTSSFFVGGSEAENATTGITLTITGSNIGNQATVDYYLEARDSTGAGTPYRFLEGNGSLVTVGGAGLDLSNQTSIENHLTAMGLSTTASHTIDYYIYVKATATGAISGDTLTSEISRQKFDTVSYDYGELVTVSNYPYYNAGDGYVRIKDGSGEWQDDATRMYFGDIDSDKYDYGLWMRWDQNIPSGATVTEYVMSFEHGGSSTESSAITATITAEANTSPDNPSSYSDYHSRTRTTNSVEWQPGSWEIYQRYSTPDLSDIVQEVVDTGEVTYLLFFIQDSEGYGGSDNLRRVYQYEQGGSDRPYLTMSYISYTASWYQIPPLSVVSLPVSKDILAVLAILSAILVVVKSKMEENE
mgnify:CR=1 FL=1